MHGSSTKESISQPALQIGVAIALGFGQWNLSGNDVCKFLAVTLKKELFPPTFLFSAFWLECEYYDGSYSSLCWALL